MKLKQIIAATVSAALTGTIVVGSFTLPVIAAEQEKAVAITEAEQKREVAELDKQVALLEKEAAILRAEGEAESKKLEAEANKALLTADGALDKKLRSFEKIHANWASAHGIRNVPNNVIGGTGEGSGADSGTTAMQSMITLLLAKQ